MYCRLSRRNKTSDSPPSGQLKSKWTQTSGARRPGNVLVDAQRVAIFRHSGGRQKFLAASEFVGNNLDEVVDFRATRPNAFGRATTWIWNVGFACRRDTSGAFTADVMREYVSSRRCDDDACVGRSSPPSAAVHGRGASALSRR